MEEQHRFQEQLKGGKQNWKKIETSWEQVVNRKVSIHYWIWLLGFNRPEALQTLHFYPENPAKSTIENELKIR